MVSCCRFLSDGALSSMSDVQQDQGDLLASGRNSRQEAPTSTHLASSLYTHPIQSYYSEQPAYDFHQYPAMAHQQQQQQLLQRQLHHGTPAYISDYISMPCNMQERMTSHQNASHMFNNLPLSIEETLANLPYDAIQLHRALSTHSGRLIAFVDLVTTVDGEKSHPGF